MNILAVSPHHQRQGLGSALLRPVLALADSENRKTYIEASTRGEPLYRKFGWKDIYTADGQGEAREDGLKREVIVLDLAKYGGPEKKVGTTQLTRDPGMGALMMRDAGAGVE
jgi:GNAT superfamily N-acetyltransferase